LPVGKNMALVLNEDGGSMGNAYLMGVDFEKYRAVFPGNVKPIEGRLPNPGKKGRSCRPVRENKPTIS